MDLNLITIANDGQMLVDTNYFDSEPAKHGYTYLSWNVGAMRLLVPDHCHHFLEEMKTGKHVTVCYGPFDDFESPDMAKFAAELDALATGEADEDMKHGFNGNGFDIVFDDDTDAPFSIITHSALSDRIMPASDGHFMMPVHIYTRLGLMMTMQGYYIPVDKIPAGIPQIDVA